MALREVRSTFWLEEPVSPRWEALALPDGLRTRALIPDEGRVLWALARTAPSPPLTKVVRHLRRAVAARFRPTQRGAELRFEACPILGRQHPGPAQALAHVLLWHPDAGWTAEAAFARPVDVLARLGDGTMAVGGDELLALRSPDGEWSEHFAPVRLTGIWGDAASRLHAMGEPVRGLRQLVPGGSDLLVAWNGLFDFDGRTWKEVRHSGLDDPSDWFWPLQCRRLFPFRSHSIGEVAVLSAVGDRPWQVMRTESRSSVLLLTGRVVVTLATPRGALGRRMLVCAVSSRGEVCLGAGGRVWRSPPLMDVGLQIWPPQHAMPDAVQ
jgi:hypothetical protein